MARILLTGGAGFIGSHTAVALQGRGHDVVLLDNFSNASRSVPARLKEITGVDYPVHDVDIRDMDAMQRVFAADPYDAVIHFAALKAVGESEENPLHYFDVNVAGTLKLLTAMRHAGVGRIVFSSSATVYGAPEHCPIAENAPLHATNVYGRTKLIMEDMISDLVRTGMLSSAFLLRYFNPVGAHPSGLIGEDPRGVPANLMPYLCQVAARKRDHLTIFGDDYPTPDGTGVRDYLHVMDLAEAHCAAVEKALDTEGTHAVNLGTGTGYSVLELVHAFENATGINIPYQIGPRRPGDAPTCYANPTLAKTMLGWSAKRTLLDMCQDSWHWQSMITPPATSLGPVHIYVCHHTEGFTFEDDVFRPIQAGRTLARAVLPMQGDDTGENISEKNGEYCELTTLYWAWKNDQHASWIGFMHYRRFLDFACTGLKTDQFGCITLPDMTLQSVKQMGLNAATVRKTIENTPGACAILPQKWSVKHVGCTSLYQHYVESDYHFAHDLALTRSVIADLYPDDLPAFDTVMAADDGYFTNVFVFRRDLFDTYCTWLFAILSEVERRADLTNYSAQARRIYGYLGERLFNVFMASSHVPKDGVIERARCFFENTKTGEKTTLPPSPPVPAAGTVTIVTAADENFVPHLAALLESIKASFNPDRFLELIVLDGGIPPLKHNLLTQQFHIGFPASKGRLTFLDCQHMYSGISTHMHFSPATFYRLSLGELLPNHSRALYIDCDTIVLTDLCRLWDVPLDGAVIAAVPDLIMKNFVSAGIRSLSETGALPARRYLSEYLGLHNHGDAYFQAGVILFDLNAFRNANISDAAIKDLSSQCYWFLDQDILNKYLIGKTKMLDTSWNCVNSIRDIFPHLNANWRAKALKDLNNPKIVHYAGYEAKPWNNRNAPLSFFYWFFLRKTFWYEAILHSNTISGDEPAPFKYSLLRRGLARGWHLLPSPLHKPLYGIASRIKKTL